MKHRVALRLNNDDLDFIYSIVGADDTLSFNAAIEKLIQTHPSRKAQDEYREDCPSNEMEYNRLVRRGRRETGKNKRRTGNRVTV